MDELNKHAAEIINILEKEYKEPKTELVFFDAYQLVVAVMLSAQTTDKKVNQVTPALFFRYPGWKELSNADLTDVENLIKQVNFYRGKADRLIKAAKFIVSEFNGEIPKSIESLIKVPGIARKSANVILQEVWNIAEGIVVDTHVKRVSFRLGLTKNTDPIKVEADLISLIPPNNWKHFSRSVVLHGRYVCVAKKPKCVECVLSKICPSAFMI